MSATDLDRALHASVLKREAWKEQQFREEKEKKDEEIRLGFGASDMCEAELKKIIDSDRRMYYRTLELNDKLYIHYKGWKEIRCLEGWTGLRALYAECNAFSQIQGLQMCRNLRSLFLSENCIRRIEGLDNCTELWSLNLANNFIEKIEGLEKLTRLNTLMLAKNKIGLGGVEDLIGLKDTNINTLDIQDNKIWDPDVLPEVFSQMESLRVLYLKGNPCGKKIPNYRKSLTVYCHDLRYLDDRPVFPEDRRAAEAFNRGGLEEERAERRRMREENNAKHESNMKAFQAMIDSARAEKRERLAMRQEDKYTDETDPVEDPERRMQRQVEQWREQNKDELRDDDRERAERCLKAERERGETTTVPEEAPAQTGDGEKEKQVDNRKLVYEDIWDDKPSQRPQQQQQQRPAFAPPPRRPAEADAASAPIAGATVGASGSGAGRSPAGAAGAPAAGGGGEAPAWYAKFAEVASKPSVAAAAAAARSPLIEEADASSGAGARGGGVGGGRGGDGGGGGGGGAAGAGAGGTAAAAAPAEVAGDGDGAELDEMD